MPKSQLRPNPHPAPGYARRAALRARPTMLSMGGGYSGKVLGTGPIAYWPLWETAGAAAECLVNPAQNGNAVGVTWADALGPDGVNGAPFFDGANDYVNIFTAAFDAAFNGATGTAMIWSMAVNAGMWTDGLQGTACRLNDDADNVYQVLKTAADDQVRGQGKAGGGLATINHTPYTNTAWFHMAITWSDGAHADEFRFFVDGGQIGAASAALNNWTGGGLDVSSTIIGASTTAPTNVWHGWLAHAVVWDRVLPPATIEALATV